MVLMRRYLPMCGSSALRVRVEPLTRLLDDSLRLPDDDDAFGAWFVAAVDDAAGAGAVDEAVGVTVDVAAVAVLDDRDESSLWLVVVIDSFIDGSGLLFWPDITLNEIVSEKNMRILGFVYILSDFLAFANRKKNNRKRQNTRLSVHNKLKKRKDKTLWIHALFSSFFAVACLRIICKLHCIIKISLTCFNYWRKRENF